MPERVTGPASYFPSIEKRYGKPIGHWLDLIGSSKLTRHKALVDWLKSDYGIGHGHATALVGYALVQRTLGRETVAATLSEVSQCAS
jgi:Domain of unknown function (DUF4287)